VRDNATSAAHHLVLNQNVATWSFCALVIFVANLRVPVNRSEGSTKTHTFVTKSQICDEFRENLSFL
jgi:hypothetical protein